MLINASLASISASLIPIQTWGPSPNGKYTWSGLLALFSSVNLCNDNKILTWMWLFVFYLVVNQAQVSITLFYALLFTSTYKDHRISDRMVVEFTTTYAISAYHH